MVEATVRKATAGDVRQLGRTLAHAFQDDPAMCWAIPDGAKRARLGPQYFELVVERIYLPMDEVYTAEDGMAAAIWAPPGNWQIPTTARSPLISVMMRASGRNFPRAARMFELIEAKHKEWSEPHYYLPFIGTDPAAQGRGLGTTLLHHMLERCDSERVAVYLEATSTRNLGLYTRDEFEIIEELNLSDGGPPIWAMWRKPR